VNQGYFNSNYNHNLNRQLLHAIRNDDGTTIFVFQVPMYVTASWLGFPFPSIIIIIAIIDKYECSVA
jgi:hypothetical protein